MPTEGHMHDPHRQALNHRSLLVMNVLLSEFPGKKLINTYDFWEGKKKGELLTRWPGGEEMVPCACKEKISTNFPNPSSVLHVSNWHVIWHVIAQHRCFHMNYESI